MTFSVFSNVRFGRKGFGERRIFGRRGEERAKRTRIGFLVLVALAALWLLACSRIHVNASWSDPAWGYFLLPLFRDPVPGDRVLFEPPASAAAAAENPRLPYMKTILGAPGMIVHASDGTVFLDGEVVGHAKTHALDGRLLRPIKPGVITPGHYYLHADHPDSHDSRYAEIGLVPRERILGFALPLPDLPLLGLIGPLVGPDGIKRAGSGREEMRP